MEGLSLTQSGVSVLWSVCDDSNDVSMKEWLITQDPCLNSMHFNFLFFFPFFLIKSGGPRSGYHGCYTAVLVYTA